ncbi:hypothetical protein SUGI_0115430 [Cryptomeria japonica]|uniref:LRR receptor-like serine/threonine-protein kinase GSO2 n=1 Tax=Cryptomeria japonica TaxID=3369 RepID=UPI002408F11F|nr:LRR receptor-like serine/threonine-protein kinase GSO2 [Cryptomeria japonica]GLJ09762.1 hypothetical protein SUGI_0115430 [Cryptomeria japonica]
MMSAPFFFIILVHAIIIIPCAVESSHTSNATDEQALLERLYLGWNNLQGNIPIEIGQVKNLGLLALLYNNLSGNIPDSLAHLQQIRGLYLGVNELTGTIPSSLGWNCLISHTTSCVDAYLHRIWNEWTCYYKRRCLQLWNNVIRDDDWKEANQQYIRRRNEVA